MSKFKFGKYAGQEISDIVQDLKGFQYLEWCISKGPYSDEKIAESDFKYQAYSKKIQQEIKDTLVGANDVQQKPKATTVATASAQIPAPNTLNFQRIDQRLEKMNKDLEKVLGILNANFPDVSFETENMEG